jgi:hypothetical protein
MGMKKFSWLTVLLLLFVISCLSDSGQKIALGNYPGVVVKRNDSVKIHLKGNDVVYSPRISATVEDGNCVIIDFSLDYGIPENSDSGKVKGFYTVNISNVTLVPDHGMRSSLTDTSVILPNEHMITSVQQRSAFILNRFFLFTEHRADTLPLHFELSCNSELVSIDGVYDLFLRVTKDIESSAAAQPTTQYNAFNLTDLSNRTNDSLHFRINYVQGFNRDSTRINWGVTPIYRFAL